MSNRLRTTIILIALFLASWTPRTINLDAFVTEDEPKWMVRSSNYLQAIISGNLANTFQREHPGVTVMWAGTLGLVQAYSEYAQQEQDQFKWDEIDLDHLLHQDGGYTPLELLVMQRRWIVLAIAIAITLGFFPLRKLFDPSLAIVSSLFVAWSPFYIALSRQLHPDGLLASLLYLSLLGFLAWLYDGNSRRYLVLSGIALGLAGLTKTPAIFLTPTAAILVALEWIRLLFRKKTNDSGRRRALWLYFILWGTLAVAVFVLFWPAMWVSPLGTLKRIIAEMSVYYVQGHSNPNYFMGKITRDPGPFFYPVAWLFRTTPATLIGLLASFILLLKKRWPFDRAEVRRTVGGLVLFSLVLAFGMTMGAKKFDRYVLPSFLALNVVAGLGWVSLTKAMLSWWKHRKALDGEMEAPGQSQKLFTTTMMLAIIIGAGLLHGIFAAQTYPYYLTYFNPLTGGSKVAERVLFIGWGEGLDQAAAWLNKQENADSIRVVSGYEIGPLSFYLHSEQPPLSFWIPDFWYDADYAVVYINQRQRQMPNPETISYFANQTPVHIVRANGFDLARIYDLRDEMPPQFSNITVRYIADFDSKIRMAAYTLDEQSFLSGEQFFIRLHLKGLEDMHEKYYTVVRLLTPNGTEIWRSVNAQNTPWPRYEIRHDQHDISIPSNLSAGKYVLGLSIYADQELNEPLSVVSSGPIINDHIAVVTTIFVREAVQVETDASWGSVWITGLQHEPQLTPGKSSSIRLQATGEVDGRFKISLRLMSSDGKTVAQTDIPLTALMHTSLDLPKNVTSGRYRLVAVVYRPETLEPLSDTHGKQIVELSHIEVSGKTE